MEFINKLQFHKHLVYKCSILEVGKYFFIWPPESKTNTTTKNNTNNESRISLWDILKIAEMQRNADQYESHRLFLPLLPAVHHFRMICFCNCVTGSTDYLLTHSVWNVWIILHLYKTFCFISNSEHLSYCLLKQK